LDFLQEDLLYKTGVWVPHSVKKIKLYIHLSTMSSPTSCQYMWLKTFLKSILFGRISFWEDTFFAYSCLSEPRATDFCHGSTSKY
jgi:hypothetical protein